MQRCSTPCGKQKYEHSRSLSTTSLSSLSPKKLAKLQRLDEKRQHEEREAAMRMYFVREEERMTKNVKTISLTDIMRKDENENNSPKKFKDKSFNSVYVLLRYQQDMLTSSYVRPASRVGSIDLDEPSSTNRRNSLYGKK